MRASAHKPEEWSYILRSGFAGGIAGCVAKTAIAPLDRVKILFQTSNPDFARFSGSFAGVFRAAHVIYAEGGARGLLQGHSATLARVFPYAAIKFMAYDRVHILLMPTREQETNMRRFAAGAIAGTSSVLVTYPLELIRVRMAFQTRPPSSSSSQASSTRIPPSSTSSPSTAASTSASISASASASASASSSASSASSTSSSSTARTSSAHARPSIRQAVRQIYHEGDLLSPAHPSVARTLFQRFPILKFYRGFTVTIIGMVPYAGTSFLAWGWLRARLLPGDRAPSGRKSVRDLAIGALSGALAQTASYPFEVVRRRMQVGGVVRPGEWLRWSETISTIYRAAGWRGFYVGLGIGYMKVVPMTAVSFAVWEAGKGLLGL